MCESRLIRHSRANGYARRVGGEFFGVLRVRRGQLVILSMGEAALTVREKL